MKRIATVPCVSLLILVVAASVLLVASSVHAIPLVWTISGTTGPGSTITGGGTIGENLRFDLHIFLDTNLIGNHVMPAEEAFGPLQGTLSIPDALPAPGLPVTIVGEYFFTSFSGGVVHGVNLQQAGSGLDKTFVTSASDVTVPGCCTDPFHPIPIAPTKASGSLAIVTDGAIRVVLHGSVTDFSATVPEGGSTALFLTLGLMALPFLRRRR